MRRRRHRKELRKHSPATGRVLVKGDYHDAAILECLKYRASRLPLRDRDGASTRTLVMHELVEEEVVERPNDQMNRCPIKTKHIVQEPPISEVAREDEEGDLAYSQISDLRPDLWI